MFWGYLSLFFSVVRVFFFSVLLYFCDSLIFAWLCLELSTLSLVPCFFFRRISVDIVSLFKYLVVSGVSSCFIVSGSIFPDLSMFFMLGLVIKFGLFPFLGWVYNVVTRSKWLVVYCFSVVMKSSFVLVLYFLNGFEGSLFFLSFLCFATLLLLCGLFWVYSVSWYHCWCHMMLSSSCVLIVRSMVASLRSQLCLYFVYFLWGRFCVLFFYVYGGGGVSKDLSYFFLYVFILLTTPLSFSILYKLFMCFVVFSCSFFVVLSWVFYSLSEQFYLFKYLSRVYIPKKLFSRLDFV